MADALGSLAAAKFQAERAQRQSDLILASVAEGVYGLDHDGCCTFVNAAASRMVGWALEELQGRSQHLIIHHSHADGTPHPVEDCPIHMTLRDGQVRQVRSDVFWRKDGRVFPVEYVVSPLPGEDGRQGAVIIFRDVSQQLAAEREREQMMTNMVAAGRLESLGSLAGGIAHEINTPIQFIGDNLSFFRDWLPRLVALIDTARRAVSSGSVEELSKQLVAVKYDFAAKELPVAIDQALDGIKRITAIVEAIRMFSYPSNKEPEPFDLNRAIKTAIVVTSSQWKHVAHLNFTPMPDLPPLNAIEGEINQVLVNLIINAAQAVSEKGAPGMGQIEVRARAIGTMIELSVSDTGIGIPRKNLDRLFDLFFTTKPLGQGTGQGLAIVRAIVTRHGGDITVESEPGVGTCFRMSLPIAGIAQA